MSQCDMVFFFAIVQTPLTTKSENSLKKDRIRPTSIRIRLFYMYTQKHGLIPALHDNEVIQLKQMQIDSDVESA